MKPKVNEAPVTLIVFWIAKFMVITWILFGTTHTSCSQSCVWSPPNQPPQLTQPETADGLGIKSYFADVTVAGYHHDRRISPKNSHFHDINLLGSTFLALQDITLLRNGREKRLDLVFDWKNWNHETLRNRPCTT